MKNNQLQTNTPNGWKFYKLNDLLTFIVDNRGKTPPIQDSGIPMAEVNAIGEKNIKYSEITKFVSEETYKNWFRKHLEKNDILFSTVGRTASCSLYIGDIKTVIAQNLIGLRFGNDNPEFMFYLLTQNENNKQFKNIEMSAAQPSVKVSQMIHLKFLLPPLPEQNRIVAVLETWDKAIEKLSKKIEIKKQIKKGLMQELLTGKKRLKGFTDKWKTKKIEDLGKYYSGITGKNKEDFGFGKPFISYMNIYSNQKIDINIKDLVNIKTNDNQTKVKYGDLFFTTSSETPDEVGVASVLLDKNIGEIYLNSFCFGFRLHNFETIIPEFAQHYFRTRQFRKSMFKIAQGASRFNLSKKYFVQIKIKIPNSVSEQKEITNILNSSDKEIQSLERKLKIFQEQKRYLLNNLITGTIRTPKNLKINI